MSEDTDDMYDDLFDKYGKVVFKRNDQKSVIAEVDDDAESLSCEFPYLYVHHKYGYRVFDCIISPHCQIF